MCEKIRRIHISCAKCIYNSSYNKCSIKRAITVVINEIRIGGESVKSKEIEWSPGTPMPKEFAVEFLEALNRQAKLLRKQGRAQFALNMNTSVLNEEIIEGVIELIIKNCIPRWMFILQTTLSVVALVIALSTLI